MAASFGAFSFDMSMVICKCRSAATEALHRTPIGAYWLTAAAGAGAAAAAGGAAASGAGAAAAAEETEEDREEEEDDEDDDEDDDEEKEGDDIFFLSSTDAWRLISWKLRCVWWVLNSLKK